MGIDSASVELRVLNKSAFDLPDRSDADADGLEGAIGIQKARSILGDISLPIARALPSLVRGTGPYVTREHSDLFCRQSARLCCPYQHFFYCIVACTFFSGWIRLGALDVTLCAA